MPSPPDQNIQQFSMDFDFQARLAALIVRDPSFLRRVVSMVRPYYFTDPLVSTIIDWTFNFYTSYQQIPGRDALRNIAENHIRQNPRAEKDGPLLLQWVDWLTLTEFGADNNAEFILDRTREFCTLQEYKRTVMLAAERLRTGNDISTIPELFRQVESELSLSAGNNPGLQGVGLDPFVRNQQLFSEPPRQIITTPWPTINQYGAPAKKELFVVAAPPGYGKSWILCAITVAAARAGLFALHITLELSEKLTQLRIHSIMSQRSIQEITGDPSIIDVAVAPVEHVGGQWYTKEYPTDSVTTDDIRSYVTMIIALVGRTPDLITIDYADLLASVRSEGHGNEENSVVRHRLNKIYKQLRRIAVEFDCAVCSASQLNAESLNMETPRLNNLAEAFNKGMVADTIWAFCQTEDEYQQQVARLFCMRNRTDVKYQTAQITTNFGRGLIVERSSGGPARLASGQGNDLAHVQTGLPGFLGGNRTQGPSDAS